MKGLSSCIAVVSIVMAFISCQSEAQENEQPNVLFIIIDDLNDYQGVFGGHPQTKTLNIDALAKSGTVFSNAHTNVPVCSPSRNSLFTGIYPHNSRDFGWTPHFKHAVLKHQKTFIELFKENGYLTLGTGKLLHKNVKKYWDQWGVPEGINYGPHAYSGIDENGKRIMGHSSVPEPFRSINVVDGSFAPLSDTPFIQNEDGEIKETGWTFGKRPYNYVDDFNRDLMPDEQHAIWAEKMIAELEKSTNERPFFMGVGFVKPHTPLYAPKKYFDMFPLEDIQMPIMQEGDVNDTFYTSVYPPREMGLHYFQMLKESFPEGDIGLRKFLQAYLACVAFVDDQVGTVLKALDNSKFKDNTIVILTSDHGWQIGEKNYLYKNSPWEESTRIPFVVRMPEQKEKEKDISTPISLIDIYPTLVDLCNLRGSYKLNGLNQKLDGSSIKPLLDNNPKAWEGSKGALTVLGAGINHPIEGVGFSSNPGALWHIEITADIEESYVLQQNYSYRTKDWRYIMYRNGAEELYHSTADVYEWTNLAGDNNYSDVKTRLRNEVLQLLKAK